ncbi:HtaA domain-containing protein [Nesterenkonia populi]
MTAAQKRLRRGAALMSAVAVSGMLAVPSAQASAALMPATSSLAPQEAEASSLVWGVRDSFRTYIRGPVAQGGWETWGVADDDGVLTWSSGVGSVDPEAEEGAVSFSGGVRYTGHVGYHQQGEAALSVEVENPTIEFGDGSGTLYADVESLDLDENVVGGEQVPVAELDFGGLEAAADSVSGVADVALTPEGAEAFAGFYEAGDPMDSLSFSAALRPVEAEPAPAEQPDPEPAEETAEPAGTPSPSPSAEPAPASAEEAEPSPPSSVPLLSAEGQEAIDEAEACLAADSGTFSWGLHESFRSYIEGPIARGEWNLQGIDHHGGQFVWAGGAGEWSEAAEAGVVAFEGGVRFTGHRGYFEDGEPALSALFENPTVEVTGTTGTLYLDVESQDLDENRIVEDQVAFGEIGFNALTVTGGSVTAQGDVTLTSEGAEAFAGFYDAGEALDPMSISFGLGEETECTGAVPAGGSGSGSGGGGGADSGSSGSGEDQAQGDGADQASLAQTGLAAGTFGLLSLLLVLGGAAVLAVRRGRVRAGRMS